MTERRPLLAANWKMNKTLAETADFMAAFLDRLPDNGTDVIVCPPFTALAAAAEAVAESRVEIAAQNMHQEPQGAFTGEVSAPMLTELGVRAVVLGHSERRQYFGETDEALARKVPAALEAGLLPILCVGENEGQRDAGEMADVLTSQIDADLGDVAEENLAQVVIAYEPIWAIGTGRTATPEQAQEACALIRVRLSGRSTDAAERVRVLYGGSVKPGNAAELMSQPDVDGALVGGAALEAEDFLGIIAAAGEAGSANTGVEAAGAVTPSPGPAGAPVPAVALVVLDGWGLAPDGPGNAAAQADTPIFDELWENYPHTTLSTSGRDVGLPPGQMGNSEVGHLNLGAGAVIKQDLARIDDAIADGSFFEDPALRDCCGRARESRRGRMHAIALVSDGGVHSGWSHVEAAIELAAEEGVSDLVLHVLTDGRDTLPRSGAGYVEEVERWLVHAGRVGTVGGRYWGMDRDKRWDRTKKAYDAIVHAEGERAGSAGEAIAAAYAADVTDEFIEPTVIGDYDGVAADEPVLFVNFRPDRARQLTMALGDPAFDEFDRGSGPVLEVTTMTEYRDGWDYPVAFPPSEPDTTIAEVIADLGERQLHVAETEKYAHVTYFFNGGREQEWSGEERALAPSPRDVPTYDHKPEMNAAGAAAEFTSNWAEEPPFKFGVINFANPDMVGHTGVIPAAVEAIEEVDSRLAEVVEAVHSRGGACIITADHGNAEQMLEPDGSPNTAHSTNPVPLIVTVSGDSLRKGGILADVAPTALALLGIDQPEAMTGTSLIE